MSSPSRFFPCASRHRREHDEPERPKNVFDPPEHRNAHPCMPCPALHQARPTRSPAVEPTFSPLGWKLCPITMSEVAFRRREFAAHCHHLDADWLPHWKPVVARLCADLSRISTRLASHSPSQGPSLLCTVDEPSPVQVVCASRVLDSAIIVAPLFLPLVRILDLASHRYPLDAYWLP